MRTYTRKRQEIQFIEDVHTLCRLCMKRVDQSIPIFTSETEACTSLALRIMICVGLEISQEDCLPKAICIECNEELNKYYDFRKKCSFTYQRLKSHVLAVKAMEMSKTTYNNLLANYSNGSQEIVDCESLNLNTEGDQNNLSVDNKIEEHIKAQESLLMKANCDETEEQSKEMVNNLIAPNISEFLATILLKLNILARKDESYVMTDLNDKTIELETGDGCQIFLELLEYEEENPSFTQHSTFENEVPPLNSQNSLKILPQINSEPRIVNFQTPAKLEEPHMNNIKSANITSNNSLELESMTEQINNVRPVCPECGKSFASRGVLRRHARVHTGERPFACRHCHRRFAQREVLRRHELVHQERRPFACTACPKSFTQRGALAAHGRTHTPPHARTLTLHRCHRCPKIFLHASGLSRHMLSHSGRTWPCGVCGRQFRDKSSLLRHERRTHALSAT